MAIGLLISITPSLTANSIEARLCQKLSKFCCKPWKVPVAPNCVALDYGEIICAELPKGGRDISGLPLRTAARIEPHVTLMEVWCTAAFRERFQSQSQGFRMEAIMAETLPNLKHRKDGAFNFQKKVDDPETWLKLYRVA